jgi:hypothetical protein
MDKKSVVTYFFLPQIIHTHTHTQEDIHEESLEDCPRLVAEDQDNKWKSLRTKVYKIDKIDNSILIDKRLHW